MQSQPNFKQHTELWTTNDFQTDFFRPIDFWINKKNIRKNYNFVVYALIFPNCRERKESRSKKIIKQFNTLQQSLLTENCINFLLIHVSSKLHQETMLFLLFNVQAIISLMPFIFWQSFTEWTLKRPMNR